MSRLVHSAITSLDGYVADRNGGFGWAAPDQDVHPAAWCTCTTGASLGASVPDRLFLLG